MRLTLPTTKSGGIWQKLRCSACGQIFTASLPRQAGKEKRSNYRSL